MKKEKMEKLMLAILTFLLILYISFSILFICLFSISAKFLNKENINKIIDKVDIVNIIKDELGTNINEFNIIEEELNKIGISEEGIENFINSDEVKEYSLNYMNKLFYKLENNKYSYLLDESEMYTLIENNYDKFNIDSDISKEEILNKIENKMPKIVDSFNKIMDKIYEKLENSEFINKYKNIIFKSINLIDYLYSGFTYFILFSILISFIMLLLFIRKNIYKSLKWLSISCLIPSIILFIMSLIISNISINSSFINNIFSIINSYIIKYFILCFIISLIFVIINFVWYMIKKYKLKEVSYE